MAELCLKLEELLVQTDAGKALLEVSIDLLRAATDDNFIAGVKNLVGQDPSGNPAGGVNDVLTQIKDKLKYIPEPEDVRRLGHELYRLLCLEQLRVPRAGGSLDVDETKVPTAGTYVDTARTGKLRLLQWGYDNTLKVYGLKTKDATQTTDVPLGRLGARWLWAPTDPAKLPTKAFAKWSMDEKTYTLYEFVYGAAVSAPASPSDLEEVHSLLEALGYTDLTIAADDRKKFTAKLGSLLQKFQHINGLPKTGELDNGTLNRLLNLDFASKNLLRAIPFDVIKLDTLEIPVVPAGELKPAPRGGYLELVNPDADHPDDEGIAVIHPSRGMDYFVCGHAPPVSGNPILPKGKGWITRVDSEFVAGFVALASRNLETSASSVPNTTPNFKGGIWSEGEAASGRCFFSARAIEPWISGRQGEPGADPAFSGMTPLFDGKKPPANARSGMYQWLAIKSLMDAKPADSDLILVASVLRRSLYTDRSKATGLPDQGSIELMVYDTHLYKGLDTRFDPKEGFLDASKGYLGSVASAPFPDHQRTTAELSLPQVERSRTWVYQATPELVVPSGAVAALVSLVGIYQSAYDIDAYFDNVIVRWDYRKRGTA